METVTIELNHYNNLRDFETAIKKNHTVYIRHDYRDTFYQSFSKDKTVKELADRINDLEETLDLYKANRMTAIKFFIKKTSLIKYILIKYFNKSYKYVETIQP